MKWLTKLSVIGANKQIKYDFFFLEREEYEWFLERKFNKRYTKYPVLFIERLTLTPKVKFSL